MVETTNQETTPGKTSVGSVSEGEDPSKETGVGPNSQEEREGYRRTEWGAVMDRVGPRGMLRP